jgi:UDP-glucose 4-epimerase
MAEKKNIVITGVAGFIGSNLADHLLASGYAVTGVDNLSYGVREQVPNSADFHEVDIRDKDLWKIFVGADAIFHLAAKNCISDCQLDPVETANINVVGTVNVFEAARRAAVDRVIYAESASLYEGSKNLPSSESDVAPESFYAVSKLAGMAFAEAYVRFHGMRTTALRYFGVYGPRQDYRRTIPPVMSAFIIALLEGRSPTIYGTGNKKRDFIYIDDVNDFHVRCLTDPRTVGETFNLGCGKPYSVSEIYGRIANLLGSNIKAIHEPDLQGEAAMTHADIRRASSLGWVPQVDLDEGLRRSIDYIKGM